MLLQSSQHFVDELVMGLHVDLVSQQQDVVQGDQQLSVCVDILEDRRHQSLLGLRGIPQSAGHAHPKQKIPAGC